MCHTLTHDIFKKQAHGNFFFFFTHTPSSLRKKFTWLHSLPALPDAEQHAQTQSHLTSCVITLTLLALGLGWVGRVPLAFILLTSLLKADMSGSRGRAMNPVPPVSASSRCSAMKGVPLPWACSCLGAGSGCSLWTFSPFKPLSTSSKDNTTPELATTEGQGRIRLN